jgi:oligopeptide transport system permease protein
MAYNDFDFLPAEAKSDKEQTRPSLTYWKDSWRRLRRNKGAMVGLFGILAIILFAVIGPLFTEFTYNQQVNKYKNIEPFLNIYEVEDGVFVFVNIDYYAYQISEDGELIDRLSGKRPEKNIAEGIWRYHYDLNGKDLILDYSYKQVPEKAEEGIPYSFIYNGIEYKQKTKTVWNKTYPLGTDNLGRDMLSRLMEGARISLLVAFVATVVNVFIGITYGAIAGYAGGKTDDIMMRIIDIIDSIPLLLYVILLMVVLNDTGLQTIILTLGLVYWVGMARMVRGQVLQLKEQEYVLAARMIGVPKHKIVFRHLIPNALGPILVSMTMMIPTAVFTEAFLSFIGLGVSAPHASWGTLANDGARSIQTAFYQLLEPSIGIALAMLSFNFFGDGMRSAFDPRLRRG